MISSSTSRRDRIKLMAAANMSVATATHRFYICSEAVSIFSEVPSSAFLRDWYRESSLFKRTSLSARFSVHFFTSMTPTRSWPQRSVSAPNLAGRGVVPSFLLNNVTNAKGAREMCTAAMAALKGSMVWCGDPKKRTWITLSGSGQQTDSETTHKVENKHFEEIEHRPD